MGDVSCGSLIKEAPTKTWTVIDTKLSVKYTFIKYDKLFALPNFYKFGYFCCGNQIEKKYGFWLV